MKKIALRIAFWAGLSLTGIFYSVSWAELNFDFQPPKVLEEGQLPEEVGRLDNAGQQPEKIIRPKVEYNAQGLRNPFAPLVSDKKPETPIMQASKAEEVKPLPALAVQGLIWGGNFPQAIINNKVVKIGDKLDEVEIKAIGQGGVTVLFAGIEHKLSSPALNGQQQDKKE